ncbi:putative uncharacterized protein DDB_G0282499 isoform X7 [Eurosta solidaginis]|uniref:putative uncharacterized protein DDB_G0282499 isoform X7 n=1 Tax=Eurosta solidaginis TaxID=178769 RepID=UPI003530D6F8
METWRKRQLWKSNERQLKLLMFEQQPLPHLLHCHRQQYNTNNNIQRQLYQVIRQLLAIIQHIVYTTANNNKHKVTITDNKHSSNTNPNNIHTMSHHHNLTHNNTHINMHYNKHSNTNTIKHKRHNNTINTMHHNSNNNNTNNINIISSHKRCDNNITSNNNNSNKCCNSNTSSNNNTNNNCCNSNQLNKHHICIQQQRQQVIQRSSINSSTTNNNNHQTPTINCVHQFYKILIIQLVLVHQQLIATMRMSQMPAAAVPAPTINMTTMPHVSMQSQIITATTITI